MAGFNGARLPEARKHGVPLDAVMADFMASMEPGFLKPGNHRDE